MDQANNSPLNQFREEMGHLIESDIFFSQSGLSILNTGDWPQIKCRNIVHMTPEIKKRSLRRNKDVFIQSSFQNNSK